MSGGRSVRQVCCAVAGVVLLCLISVAPPGVRNLY